MRLALLTAVTMLAFAANSILNRMALAGDHIDAFGFVVIRVLSGAAMLVLLVVLFGTMMVRTDKNRPTTIPVCFSMQ